MKTFLRLLKNHKTVRYLLFIQFICNFAAWFVHMAIYTLLIGLNAPVWVISTTAALGFFSGVVFAPFSGAIIDKIPIKPLLLSILSIEIVSAFLLIFIDSLEWIGLLFVLLFVRMSLAALYFQAIMSLFPRFLSGGELKSTNELNSLIWSIAYVSGMGLAGLFVHIYGVDLAILTNVFLYVFALFLLLKTPIPNFLQKSTKNFLFSMLEGIVYLRKKPLLLHLMFLHASVGLTSYDALVALLSKYNYAEVLSIPLVVGLINVFRAIGLSLGIFSLNRFLSKNTLFYFFVFQALGILAWAGLEFNFYTGLVGTFLAGIWTALLWSFTYTLLQTNTSKKFYGRVVAYNDMIFLTSSTLTSFGIGFLFDLGLNAQSITALIGLCFFGFGFYYLWIKRTYM